MFTETSTKALKTFSFPPSQIPEQESDPTQQHKLLLWLVGFARGNFFHWEYITSTPLECFTWCYLVLVNNESLKREEPHVTIVYQQVSPKLRDMVGVCLYANSLGYSILCKDKSCVLKQQLTQKYKFSHYQLTLMLLESLVKSHSPQNISGAWQHNSIVAFT